MNNTLKAIFLAAIIFFIITPKAAFSQESRLIKGFEVLTGFGKAKLTHDQGNYDIYPLIFDLSFDLKEPLEKAGFRSPGILQFQLEPFISYVSNPKDNYEAGTAFMIKFGLVPEDWKLQPFARAGLGMLFMGQNIDEQSTKFNFLEQGGLGATYFFDKNFGLTLECRYRHVSNMGIRYPNHGVNSLFYLLGVAYQY